MHKSATVEKVAIFVVAGLDLCTSSNCLADSDGFSTGANSAGRRNAVWFSEAGWQCPLAWSSRGLILGDRGFIATPADRL